MNQELNIQVFYNLIEMGDVTNLAREFDAAAVGLFNGTRVSGSLLVARELIVSRC